MPKCLAPVAGRPLLSYWLHLCQREGIDRVLLNVSHHADQVDAFLRDHTPRGVAVTVVRETAPAGTATTVARERAFVAGESDFWVFYADNLSDMQLAPMRALHATHRDPLTIGLFHTPFPRASGIVETEPTGRIVSFVEKPDHPTSDLANAGVYLARASVFDAFPDVPGMVDFGHHVLPALVGRMYGHVIEDFHEDIGTPERLARASAAWTTRTRQ